MIEIVGVKTLDELQELREDYMKKLIFVQDLNAEENVWECEYYKLSKESKVIGYFCVDSEKTLWEFYIIENEIVHSQEVFQMLIDRNYIIAAECKSFDHLLLSLCFDYQKKASCSAYLFRNDIEVELSSTAFDKVDMRLATKEDYDSLSKINYIAEGVNFFHDLEMDIKNEEVFVFYSENELLGSGTMKKVWHNMNYYDIGMLVHPNHRKKGIGTLILIKLREYCYRNNRIPVCGCWYFNYSSKKTLEKAGFLAEHRMIRFEFSE